MLHQSRALKHRTAAVFECNARHTGASVRLKASTWTQHYPVWLHRIASCRLVLFCDVQRYKKTALITASPDPLSYRVCMLDLVRCEVWDEILQDAAGNKHSCKIKDIIQNLATTHLSGNLICKIFLLLLNSFSKLEFHKSSNHDVFAYSSHGLLNYLTDLSGRIHDVILLQKSSFVENLVYTTWQEQSVNQGGGAGGEGTTHQPYRNGWWVVSRGRSRRRRFICQIFTTHLDLDLWVEGRKERRTR